MFLFGTGFLSSLEKQKDLLIQCSTVYEVGWLTTALLNANFVVKFFPTWSQGEAITRKRQKIARRCTSGKVNFCKGCQGCHTLMARRFELNKIGPWKGILVPRVVKHF